jgi:F-type H+-transporting ATPase subunit gamma
MLSTRDIQRKIRTVRNIQQICKAMKTVSSIKLRKAEERIMAARPYAVALRNIVSRLSGAEYPHPLLEVRNVQHAGVVAISADKGLAGSYNTNLIRVAVNHVKALPDPRLVPLGARSTTSSAGWIRLLKLPSRCWVSNRNFAPSPRWRTRSANYTPKVSGIRLS